MILFTVIILICFSVSLYPSGNEYAEDRLMLGTAVKITLITDSDSKARKALDDAFGEIERLENLISYYKKNSDISGINDNSGTAIAVSDETFYLIDKCKDLSEMSGGAFDITFAGIGRLWKFGTDFVPPSDADIKSNLKLVNYRNIILDKKNKTVKLAIKGMKIGLGSIGKRHAIGLAISKLRANGITDAIVLTGGDLQAIGTKFGKSWNIGVQNPRQDNLLYSFPAKPGETISTSGDYERMQIYRGIRYHHIFDPRTGYPAKTFASVTVITGIPENADGLSTAIFVMGKDNYRKLLNQFKDTFVILIDLDLKIYISKELKNRIKPLVKEAENINWI